jgi:hypothetical protein
VVEEVVEYLERYHQPEPMEYFASLVVAKFPNFVPFPANFQSLLSFSPILATSSILLLALF